MTRRSYFYRIIGKGRDFPPMVDGQARLVYSYHSHTANGCRTVRINPTRPSYAPVDNLSLESPVP